MAQEISSNLKTFIVFLCLVFALTVIITFFSGFNRIPIILPKKPQTVTRGIHLNKTRALFNTTIVPTNVTENEVVVNIAPYTMTKLKKAHPIISNVNCRALIEDNKEEQKRVTQLMANETQTLPQTGQDYTNKSSNCDEFKEARGYLTSPVNEVEKNFSIAFSILMFKDIEQTERLLRAIYRPQNVYCIHVDAKADSDIKKGMDSIAECFENVYIVPDPSDVKWGTFTVLEPELKCMKILWGKKKWKYFINLTGQEFPLKTNLELVQILNVFDGANNLEGTRKRANLERWALAPPAPHGIKPTKGSIHALASRGFVDYLLHNQTAIDFLNWVKDTSVPDETYFSSLNHNPQLLIPGSYKGEPETDEHIYPFLIRYKGWAGSTFHYPCSGKYVRGICIFGIGDLPELTGVPHLFANKFHWDYQHYTRDCLEEWHFNKTLYQLNHDAQLNLTFYKDLPFLKNIVGRQTLIKL